MTKPAILKLADARRLAKVAKSEDVAISIESDGIIITIFPDYHKPSAGDIVDEYDEIIL